MLFNSVAEITDGEENVSITVRHWSLTQTPSLASMAFCQLFQKIGIPMAQLVSIKPISSQRQKEFTSYELAAGSTEYTSESPCSTLSVHRTDRHTKDSVARPTETRRKEQCHAGNFEFQRL